MTEQHPPEPEANDATTPAGEPTSAGETEPTATRAHEPVHGPVGEPVAAEPPPPRKRGVPLWAKILVPVVIVLIVLAGGGFAAYKLVLTKSHDLSTPSTAGKMKRDSAVEKKYASQIKVAQQQFGKQVGSTDYVKAAIYDQNDTKLGPKGSLLFIGAKLSGKSAKQNPATWIKKKFTTPATTNGFKVTKVSLSGDARGACATSTQAQQQGAVCVWATNDTVGELVPTTTGYSAKSLGAIMKALRDDVETT